MRGRRRGAHLRRPLPFAREIDRLGTDVKTGKMKVEDLQGSTFTITSLGALGGLVTTPIINQPEVAIVGVKKIETRPVWRNGTWEPRQMCNLSSSFDHRVVDGAEGARFLNTVVELLENPAQLLG